jgi:hypothetical protein
VDMKAIRSLIHAICHRFDRFVTRCKKARPNDDLNGVVVSNADCQSKGPGFESRVSHGPFQKV